MAPGPARAYVGIGSNLERKRNLKRCVAAMRERFGRLSLSPVYRNAAVGFEGPDFYNLVTGLDTTLPPGELVAVFEELHRAAGRRRGSERFASRTLDVDLLLYDDLVCESPPLPRPDVLEQAFVLKPLAELSPDYRHPLTGRTLADHWDEMRAGSPRLERVEVDLGAAPVAGRG